MDNMEIFFIIFILLLIVIRVVYSKRDKFVSTGEFDREKVKLKPRCSEAEINDFMKFLYSYEGGYFKRRSGKIVHREYSNKEKGDLKGIFYNIVLPNSNLPVSKREEFRKMLVRIGVDGLNERPSYETREAKLRNKVEDEQEHKRKEVGNKGEKIVRDELHKLDSIDFSVINGPVLKVGDDVKEYDHIVVGRTGIFAIETKAFGMKDGNANKNWLFIDKGDKWIIGKGEHSRELASPTEQVKAEKELLLNILSSTSLEIHPVLVLSNEQLIVKNNIKLNYDVVRVDELIKYLSEYEDSLNDGERLSALSIIDEHRIN